MKKTIIFFSIVLAIISFTSCTKDDIEIEPYKTGIIKFEYQKSTIVNGLTTVKDTIVKFTSIGNNPNQADNYGYSNSSIPWVIMERLNPDNFSNRGIIFFSGTNLNSLTMPYTFNHQDINMDAQINYVVDEKIIIDNTGQQISVTNTYAATTYSNNFELIILSKDNNRLQGTFDGEIKNQDGDIINVKKGMFDIQIVEKQLPPTPVIVAQATQNSKKMTL